jgi:hypothetical protein
MFNWRGIGDKEFGLMTLISECFVNQCFLSPELFPNLKLNKTLFIFSDYSGQHKSSSFDVYSFLIVDIKAASEWHLHNKLVRETFLSNGRRMSFKNMNDKVRRRALIPFLNAANSIPGMAISFLVHKEIGSLFDNSRKLKMTSEIDIQLPSWKLPAVEHLLRIVHFFSLIVSSMSTEGQDIIWITDQDDITANRNKLKESTSVCGNILSHYLDFDLGHIRLGSVSTVDKASREMEDLCAIPDLIAGALAESLNVLDGTNTIPPAGLYVPLSISLISCKTQIISQWISKKQYPLKKMNCVILINQRTQNIMVKMIDFKV